MQTKASERVLRYRFCTEGLLTFTSVCQLASALLARNSSVPRLLRVLSAYDGTGPLGAERGIKISHSFIMLPHAWYVFHIL